jgi:subtilisin family serine protease
VYYIKVRNLTDSNIELPCNRIIRTGISKVVLNQIPRDLLESLQESGQLEILECSELIKDANKVHLAQDFSILSVIRRLEATEKIDLGVQLVGAPLAWNKTKGEGIGVLVIDTGIDNSHIDLMNNVKSGMAFVGKNPNDWKDHLGHGTLVAGIVGAEDNGAGVIGVAPKCNIYAAKVIDNSGVGSPKAIKDAIEWAIEKKTELGIHIINMSLGSPTPCDIIKAALIRARKAGLIVVCASGNNGNGQLANYPGKYAEEGLCICVSAIDNNKQIAKFSNTGKEAITFAAPGVNIYSTYINNTYATMSGTSFAAPIISGLCALVYAKHKDEFDNNPTPHTNLDIMIKRVRKLVDVDTNNFQDLKNNNFGWGIPQITEANIEILQYEQPLEPKEERMEGKVKDNNKKGSD